MLRRMAVCGLMVMTAVGCGATSGEDAESQTADLAEANALRMNQFQAKGTHNSYHDMRWWMPMASLRYDHKPLDEQADRQGVRAFELDLQFKGGRFKVHHVDLWDSGSNCPNFTDCLSTLKRWSDAHPKHQPLFVQLEAKDPFDATKADDYVAALDREILSVWPKDRIVTPDLVKGNATSVREAITTTGWPTMESARGKIIFFLQPDAARRDHYTHGDKDLAGRLTFVNSGLDRPYAALAIFDDPKGEAAKIKAAVQAGFIVRTRADADVEEPKREDHSREVAAWASGGAQIVSTDFPAKTNDYDYFVTVPGGAPSRCNPFIAPEGCVASDIEDM